METIVCAENCSLTKKLTKTTFVLVSFCDMEYREKFNTCIILIAFCRGTIETNNSPSLHWNNFAIQHFNISIFQNFNISTFQDFKISTFQHFKNSTFQEFNISRFQHFKISTFQDFNISRLKSLPRILPPVTALAARASVKIAKQRRDTESVKF